MSIAMGRKAMGLLLVLLAFIFLNSAFNLQHKPKPYPLEKPFHFPALVPYTNQPTIAGVDLGRHLFYDPILSIDSSISCASCHKQEFAFADTTRFSSGISGKKQERNTPGLFNLAWLNKLFWDGRANNIEEQVFHPVRSHNEMGLTWIEAEKRIKSSSFYTKKFQKAFPNEKIDSNLIALAIAQFERTLISHNSKYDKTVRGETFLSPTEFKGFVIVNDQSMGNCLHCHTTDANALGTTGNFSNNGLDYVSNPNEYIDKGLGGISNKTEDYGKFKIPSLRNIALTKPYMHDGRFNSLDEVLTFYNSGVRNTANIDSKMSNVHRGGIQLTPEELGQVKAFLLTLTDSSFINNPKFSNPFH